MGEVIKVKVRKIGTSLGVLIPKRVIETMAIKEGQEVEIALLERRLELIEKLAGSVKSKRPFVRDKTDRLEKLGY